MLTSHLKHNYLKAGKKLVVKASIFCLIMAFVLIPLQNAEAQSVLELSTPYPGITASPGENVTFDLKLVNNSSTSRIVGLEVTSHPKNWTASIRGNGREIQQVYVKALSFETADLKVKIPEKAKPGDYSLTVSAIDKQGYHDYLNLNIKIKESTGEEDRLVAQYAELKGPGDATFTFKLDLINNGSREQIYSLGAQAPAGWQVSFKPSYERQQVASISVKPGETQGLDVKVVPPASVKAGEYTIPVKAVSSAGTASETLKVIISGTYDLQFTTPSGRLNADIIAGREKEVTLEIINNGSAVLNNINFSSREPQDWSVSFDPKTIDTLKPGESRQVTATIKADNKAIAGDYLVTLTASTRETTDQTNLRVTVKTSTLWGAVGLLIILLVIAGVYWAFRTYGRR